MMDWEYHGFMIGLLLMMFGFSAIIIGITTVGFVLGGDLGAFILGIGSLLISAGVSPYMLLNTDRRK